MRIKGELRERLLDLSLEDFANGVSSFMMFRGLGSPWAPAIIEADREIRNLVREVAESREICTACFRGQERNVGGRNGGEERYVCSNPECSRHR